MDILNIIVTIALLVFLGYKEYMHTKERETLIKAIMAKDLTDYSTAKSIESTKPMGKTLESIPVESLSDEDFNKFITN